MFARDTVSGLDGNEIDDPREKIFRRLVDESHRLLAEGSIFDWSFGEVDPHGIPVMAGHRRRYQTIRPEKSADCIEMPATSGCPCRKKRSID
jgi:hypothetical protein